MQTTSEHTVKVLNSLIETTLDSANGYRDAAETTESAQYRSMFSTKAQRRMELAQQLQQEVRSFGAEPETDQSAMGKVHNKFTELKAAVTGADDKSVINEVERGEDVIKAKYEKALRDDDLPTEVRDLLNQAFGSIKADHDEISRLKHTMN